MQTALLAQSRNLGQRRTWKPHYDFIHLPEQEKTVNYPGITADDCITLEKNKSQSFESATPSPCYTTYNGWGLGGIGSPSSYIQD